MVVIRVKLHEQADLAEIVQARDALALGLGACQGRQEQASQNGDDRNDHKKFNQGETAVPS